MGVMPGRVRRTGDGPDQCGDEGSRGGRCGRPRPGAAGGNRKPYRGEPEYLIGFSMLGIRPWEIGLLSAAEYELIRDVLDAQRIPRPDSTRLDAHEDRLRRIRLVD